MLAKPSAKQMRKLQLIQACKQEDAEPLCREAGDRWEDTVVPTPFAAFVDGLPADGWCIYDIVVHFDGGGLTTLATKENLKLEATLDTLMQEKTTKAASCHLHSSGRRTVPYCIDTES